MHSVIMPNQGLQMTEGTIIQWLKKEGDEVREDEPLFEIETDKLTIAIDAPASGVLLKIFRNAGEIVPVTEEIAIIGEKGEDTGRHELKKTEETPENVDTPLEKHVVHMEESNTIIRPMRTYISPRAKEMAKNQKIDYQNIKGSGPEGMIREGDIKRHIKQTGAGQLPSDHKALSSLMNQPADIPASQLERDKLIPLTAMRKAIGERLWKSQKEAASATVRMVIDMSEAGRLKKIFKENGQRVTFNDMIVKAICYALKFFPIMNSELTEEGIWINKDIHIGIAVATEKGLMVPVIRNADKMKLSEISSTTVDIANRAKLGKLKREEYTGSTFTISNLGMFGVQSGEAILNSPETGIMMTGEIKDTPIAMDGMVIIKALMVTTLTYDHRVLDGAVAAQFTAKFREALESPYIMV